MSPLDVVTGGAGFIGSHLAEALRDSGRRVRGVDDLSTGKRSNVPAGVEFLQADVTASAAEAVRGAEVVYHLAAIPSVPKSVERPLENHRATAESTLAVLLAAERAGARRVVFASSSAVYGDGMALPKREEMAPRPLSPYAVAKLSGELYVRSMAEQRRVEGVSLRFFNVYGPRQDPDSPYAGVIPIFVRALAAGRPLPVYGDGRQTRDFTWVGDVVRGILRAGAAAGVSGRVYNVAAGRPVSVADLGRLLGGIMGREAALDFRPPRPGDIRESWADVSAAGRDLGHSSETSLEEGLRRTVEWFRPR